MSSIIVLVLLASLAVCGMGEDCKVAPRFWCNSVSIAEDCGVLPSCLSRLASARPGDAVNVSVFFESKCSDSIHFITTMLYPTWEKLQHTGIMDLELFPFGKAFWSNTSGSLEFRCQHGAVECLGNKIQNCLISAAGNDENQYLPVVQCMELNSLPVVEAETCVTKGGLDWQTINTCANGSEGDDLLLEAGQATKSLNPRLNWVPWVVINGVHTDDIQTAAMNDLLSLVCETYQGELPTECKKPKTLQTLQTRKLGYVPGF